MKTITVLVIAALCVSIDAGAQTAAAWNFANSSAAPYFAGANISATSVTMGPDVTGGANFSGNDFYGLDGWPSTTTIDPNAYMQFILTPATGYFLQLTHITVGLRHSTLGSTAGSGPASWQLRSSADNYVSVLASGSLTTAYTIFTIDLPANFPGNSSAVTFRFYGYNEFMTAGGSNRFVTDELTVTGTAVSATLATQSIDLSAAASGQAVDLQWQTVGFSEGTTFLLQRSADGTQFSNLETVSGNTAVDNSVTAGQWFYRIEARSPDGTSSYSPIVMVTIKGSSAAVAGIKAVSAQGNLVRTFLHLPDAGTYQLSIRTMDGQSLYRTEMSGQTGDITTDIGFGTRAHGVYVVTLVGGGTTQSREFVY